MYYTHNVPVENGFKTAKEFNPVVKMLLKKPVPHLGIPEFNILLWLLTPASY